MLLKYFPMQLVFPALILMLAVAKVSSYKRNYEAKYTKANVPLWKQRACEKAQKYKANSHYVCDDKGDVKCLPGWQGDLCQVPMCRKSCDPMNGYCQRPGECRCHIGYTGELCDKCIPLPGCQHGDCTKPFECICRPGWDGLFCTEPTCRQGCHNTRGYCEGPGECRCRIGWAGRNCSDCSVLPGCQHGTCSKPLECKCLTGYTGLLCQTPICNADCDKQHGYCKKPGECRCKVGWSGPNCDKCFPYPGCVNGDCEKPWECNCKPGWGGILCDEKLTYCKDHPDICENNGKCISLTKGDGSYRCYCKNGYLGKNCEIVDEFLLTSTAAPRITPPPLVGEDEEDNENDSASLNDKNVVHSTPKDKKKIKNSAKITNNGTVQSIKPENMATSANMENVTLSLNVTENINNKTKLNDTKVIVNLELKQDKLFNASLVEVFGNATKEYLSLPTTSSPTTADIIGTATADMNTIKKFSNAVKTKTSTSYMNNTSTATPASSNRTIASTKSSIVNNTSTTISPLSKLEDEKNLQNMPLKLSDSHKKPEEDDDDDEECTDDNDDECEYVDEDEDDD